MGGAIDAGRRLAWAALVVATGMLVRVELIRPRIHPEIITFANLVYRRVGLREARLDLYLPRRPAPPAGWPTIVAIHGGSWRGGTKNGFGREFSRLALHGYAVASVEYVLARPGRPSWPDCLADIREAVRWVRRHAADYTLDPSRLAALGASAGGHLATLLGTNALEDDPEGRVAAVIDLFGPTDLARLHDRPGADVPLDLFLGGPPETIPSLYDEASPMTHASADDAPTLMIHGDLDDSVPLDQSTALLRRLRSVGVRSDLIVVRGQGHTFRLDVPGHDYLPEVVNFLDGSWPGR